VEKLFIKADAISFRHAALHIDFTILVTFITVSVTETILVIAI
jgi:hypothetical protein